MIWVMLACRQGATTSEPDRVARYRTEQDVVIREVLAMVDPVAQEAEVLACEILKQVMEEKISNVNIEIASVTKEKGYHMYGPVEISELIVRL